MMNKPHECKRPDKMTVIGLTLANLPLRGDGYMHMLSHTHICTHVHMSAHVCIMCVQ